MTSEADAPERVRNLLAAAFRIVDGIAGAMNGVPNEDTGDEADVVASDLAEVLDVPFDENWPAACADVLTRTPSEAVAEVERLREALKPFADALAEWGEDTQQPDRWSTWEHPIAMLVTLGDFRAASRALKEQS